MSTVNYSHIRKGTLVIDGGLSHRFFREADRHCD